ncbi:MAG TPA: TraR/DksA family transcriptional regulator [Candidatus Polarisedimenticolaceae bacterium]|nr:TraR/DksA family transcriptional regulator [Candidatus Polarisedimenticolaceae bacterium]
MKAKPSKAKAVASKAAKPAPKSVAKAAAVKPAPSKLAPKKAVPAAKTSAKSVLKGAAKPVAKAPAKPAVKLPSRALREAKGKLATRAAAAKPAPKAPARRVPKPASVATRRRERAHFRELLLRKRQDLMRAYSISKGDSQSDLDNGTEDYVDYAVNSYAREFLLSLTEMERKQLLLVEDALNRIDRGEYGYCQQCGEEIAPKRLEVQPWARHCVRCQELEEQGLLPHAAFQVSDEDELAEEPEEAAPADEEFEPEPEAEDEVLDDEPLVVDGDDTEA